MPGGEGCLRFETNNALVQQNLIEHAAQLIAIAFVGHSNLHCLRDCAAERTCRTRELGQYLAANLSGVAWRRDDACTISADDFAAERFLFIRALHHIDLAVESEVLASHAQSRTPLSCASFGGNALQALLLSIVSLSDCRVQLVRTAGVVALELIEYLGRRVERLFQELRMNERTWAEHLVEVQDFFGDVEPLCIVVKLLLYEFFTENRLHLSRSKGLTCARIQ